MLSPSARYMWATARALNSAETGSISVFLLGDDGSIARRMFRAPTTTADGRINAISPAFWSDEYAAMADYNDEGHGYVQIWRMDGSRDTREGTGYATALPVAKVDIPDGGCCANTIWYS